MFFSILHGACRCWRFLICLIISSTSSIAAGAQVLPDPVVWETLGKSFRDSMPVGNGDIGLNVWTEANGDLVFLIGKTDAWTENGQLVKLGRVRVRLTPNPFVGTKTYRQILRPDLGEIELQGESGTSVHIWVDANRPVIHVKGSGQKSVDVQASVELWRTKPRETFLKSKELEGRGVFRELNGLPEGKVTIDPDTVLPAANNLLKWAHRNTRSIYPATLSNQHLESLLVKYPDPLLNRTFGVAMKGVGMTSSDDQTLKSCRPTERWQIELYALTQQVPDLAQWSAALDQIISTTDRVSEESALTGHRQWWTNFWNRSWIRVSGTPEAEKVTQGYAMQRWVAACAGRGAMPIKYNGAIFTVGQESPEAEYDPAKGEQNADFRAWGGNYWFQNTRLLYWPMIAAGDFDLLAPWFQMYRNNLPLATDRTKLYFKHDGVAFPETIFFWGLPNDNDFGWGNPGVIIKNTWIRHYVQGGLELTAMMLDRYDYQPDDEFARKTLLPISTAVTTFYDQHWQRGADGRIHMDPAQALETNQQAINPAPDIAGLQSVLPRLLALSSRLTTEPQRSLWKKLLSDLPPLPQGRAGADGQQPLFGEDAADGNPILLPAEKYSKPNNVENAELYAIFPYQLFGVDRPELDLARNTFQARRFKSSTCWGQDGMQSAILGLVPQARAEATANFTAYGGERFPWFWRQGHDWEPDLDNGGAGMSTLQLMLLQTRGQKILLFPAWPKEWKVEFKLHAPNNTVVEGSYQDGKVAPLKVTPTERAHDIIVKVPQ